MARGSDGYWLKLLGSFSLLGPNGHEIEISSKKGMAILAMLAMTPDGSKSRVWLQNVLWGDRGAAQAQSSLRRELSNLRKKLGASGKELISSNNFRIHLDLDMLGTDARDLLNENEAILKQLATSQSSFLEGLDIPGSDAFEDWLRIERGIIENKFAAWQSAEKPMPEFDPLELVKAKTLKPPIKPSIAVLPFQDLSNNDNSHFAEGMVEEIAQALSEYSTLFVVSGNGSLAYQNQETNFEKLSQELGVQYLLTGSVRCHDQHVRTIVKLIGGNPKGQVWSDSFDGEQKDIFSLQKTIADAVAPCVDSTIEKSRRERASSKPINSKDAHQLYWRANSLFRRWEKDAMIEAIELSEQLLVIEPENSWALSLAAFCCGTCYASKWTDNPSEALDKAKDYHARAMQIGSDDPFVLGYGAGTLMSIAGNLEAANALIDRALAINPNFSASLFWGGWVDIASGKMERALQRFNLALRLNPRSAVRPYSITGIGLSLLSLGRFEEAIVVLEEAVHGLPNYPFTLAGLCISYRMIGKQEIAQEYAERLHKNGGVDQLFKVVRDPAYQKLLKQGIDFDSKD